MHISHYYSIIILHTFVIYYANCLTKWSMHFSMIEISVWCHLSCPSLFHTQSRCNGHQRRAASWCSMYCKCIFSFTINVNYAYDYYILNYLFCYRSKKLYMVRLLINSLFQFIFICNYFVHYIATLCFNCYKFCLSYLTCRDMIYSKKG